MKKLIAIVLALALLLALAGCKNTGDTENGGGQEPPEGGQSGGGQDPSEDNTTDNGKTDDNDPSDDGDDRQDPPDEGGVTVALTSGSAAGAFASVAARGREVVTDASAAEGVKAGDYDAAVIAVADAARLYRESGGAVNVAALLTSGGWVVAEKGEMIDGILGLGGKTVYAPEGAGDAMAVLGYIAGEYGFEVGDTIKIEAASDAASRDVALLPEDGVGEGQRAALNLLAEWEYATGRELLPGLCLVVRSDMETDVFDALLEAVKNAVSAASDTDATKYIFVTGTGELRNTLEDYLELLYGVDSSVIGGSIPDDGFYK